MIAPPATTPALADDGFMDARAKMLDIAAFLDRLDRHAQGSEDYRIAALRSALTELHSETPGRVARILDQLSDPSQEPIEQATEQGAAGAYLNLKS